jgi:hypothetical protein
LPVMIKCGIELLCMHINVFLRFLKAYVGKTVHVLMYFMAVVLVF